MTSKEIYTRVKNDYNSLITLGGKSLIGQTNFKKRGQTGGYVTMQDALIDELLNMLNIKLFIEISKKFVDNKPAYDNLAKLVLDRSAYLKYSTINKDDQRIFHSLVRFRSDLARYYSASSPLFDSIKDHFDGVKQFTPSEKISVIRDLEKVFGASFWKKISLIDKSDLVRSIFIYYNDVVPTFKESDNVVVVDSDNYILYRYGEVKAPIIGVGVGAVDVITTRFFVFNRDTFTVKEIKDLSHIQKIILYTKKEFILSNKNVYTTNFSMYDAYTMYGRTSEAIRKMIALSTVSDEDSQIVKVSSLAPSSMAFMSNVFNIKRGEFTNRNTVIYAMLFTNRIKILFDLMTDVLTNRLDLSTDDDIKISDVVDDMNPEILSDVRTTVYADSPSRDLLIDRRLYAELVRFGSLASLLRAYNYYYLVNLTNNIDMDVVKRDPLDMLHHFVKDLKYILTTTVAFKTELLQFVKKIDSSVFAKPNDFIKLFIIIYILYVVREKSNIHINKTRVIDTLLTINRNMDRDTGVHSKQHVSVTRWISNASSMKKEFKRLREFSDVYVNGFYFPSCGETATLNLMNYILMKKGTDVFVLPKGVSVKFAQFYSKYPDLTTMLAKEKQAVNDWANLIANQHGVAYNKGMCELVPSDQNVFKLYSHFIPSMNGIASKNIIGIADMIRTIDSEISTKVQKDNAFEVLLVDDYCVKFSRYHGEMDVYVTGEEESRVEARESTKESVTGCQNVLNAIMRSPTDIIERVLFLERVDIIKTKEFMDVVNSTPKYVDYILTNSPSNTAEAVFFNKFSNPELITSVINRCNTMFADANFKAILTMVLTKIETADEMEAYIDVLYKHVHAHINEDLRQESVKQCIGLLTKIDPELYIKIAIDSSNPVYVALKIGVTEQIIDQMIKMPESDSELSILRNFNAVTALILARKSVLLFDTLINSRHLDVERIKFIANGGNTEQDYENTVTSINTYIQRDADEQSVLKRSSLIVSAPYTSRENSNTAWIKHFVRYVKSIDMRLYLSIIALLNVPPLAITIYFDKSEIVDYLDHEMFRKELETPSDVLIRLRMLVERNDQQQLPLLRALINSKYVNSGMIEETIKHCVTYQSLEVLMKKLEESPELVANILNRSVLFDVPNKVEYVRKRYEYGAYDYQVNRNALVTKYFSMLPQQYFNTVLAKTQFSKRLLYSLMMTMRFKDLTEYLKIDSPDLTELKTPQMLEMLLMLSSFSEYPDFVLCLVRTNILPDVVLQDILKQDKYSFLSKTVLDLKNKPDTFSAQSLNTIYKIYSSTQILERDRQSHGIYRTLNTYDFQKIETLIASLSTKTLVKLLQTHEKTPLLKSTKLNRPDVLTTLLERRENTTELDTEKGYTSFADSLVDVLATNHQSKQMVSLFDGIYHNLKIASLFNRYAKQIDDEKAKLDAPTILKISTAMNLLINQVTLSIDLYTKESFDIVDAASQHINYLTKILFKSSSDVLAQYSTHVENIFKSVNDLAKAVVSSYPDTVDELRYYVDGVYLAFAFNVVKLCRSTNKLSESQFALCMTATTYANTYKLLLDRRGLTLLTSIPEAYAFLLEYQLSYVRDVDITIPSKQTNNIIKYVITRHDLRYDNIGGFTDRRLRELLSSLEPILRSQSREFNKGLWDTLETVRRAVHKENADVINTLFHNMIIDFREKDDDYSFDASIFDETGTYVYVDYDEHYDEQYDEQYEEEDQLSLTSSEQRDLEDDQFDVNEQDLDEHDPYGAY